MASLTITLDDELLPLVQGAHQSSIQAPLCHVPSSLKEAVVQIADVAEANQRIKDGFYKDRLLFIIAQPKSGSSGLGNIVSELFQAKGLPGRGYPAYMQPNQDANLRLEMVRWFLDGGVIKYHPAPISPNLRVLKRLKCKQILTFRHPADQLVAQACNLRGLLDESLADEVTVYDHIYPIERKFAEDRSDGGMDRLIFELIEGGYLLASLNWCAQWCHLRDKTRSIVSTYEDLMMKKQGEIARLSDFLFGETTCMAEEEFDERFETGKSSEKVSDKYPFGYTGKVGVYRDYFTQRAAEKYNEIVEAFMQTQSQGLDEYQGRYKNLLIDPKTCKR